MTVAVVISTAFRVDRLPTGAFNLWSLPRDTVEVLR